MDLARSVTTIKNIAIVDHVTSWFVFYTARTWGYLRGGCFTCCSSEETHSILMNHPTSALVLNILSPSFLCGVNPSCPWLSLAAQSLQSARTPAFSGPAPALWVNPAALQGGRGMLGDPSRSSRSAFCCFKAGCSSGWLTPWRSSKRQLECIQVG